MRICELFENVNEYDLDNTGPTLDDVNRIANAINKFARDNGVTAELRQFPQASFPAIELTDLFAERLGSGDGTKVMQELSRMADEADINVYLRPSEPRNKIFYARFGFEPDPQHRSMMVRYPPYELDEEERDIAKSSTIQFKTWNNGGVPRHSFRVVYDGKIIAYGEVEKDSEWEDEHGASVQEIVVNHNYRRKGIATKIYNAIERKFNYKLHPSDDVKPDGKEFWNYRSNVNEGVKSGKVKLFTDPDYFGAEVSDTGFDSLPVVNISIRNLVGFEPDSKMKDPKSKANVKKMLEDLKKGNSLPPILVRKTASGYQVLDGHHRFYAYKLLKRNTIPARVVPAKDIEEISKKDVKEDFSSVSSKDADDKIDDQERKRNLDNFLSGNHPSVPKILYHGSRSDSDFEVFKPSFGTYGTGIYLTDKPNVASDFAMGIRGGATDEKMGGRVIPLYVSMKQPFTDEYLRHTEWKKYIEDVIDKNFKRSHLWRREEYEPIKDNILKKLDNGTATIRDLFIDKNNNVLQDLGCNEIAETIHRSGFDGIIINRPDSSIEYVIFKPEQVKSAIGNIGTFDPHKPNINEEDTTDNIYYHVTPAKNVKWIMQEGLTPSTGSASSSYGETEERLYLFSSLIDAQDAVNNWLGDQYEEDILALLQVDAAGINLKSDVEWEFYTNQTIPPNRIKILSMDM